jgi:hypothetical protein
VIAGPFDTGIVVVGPSGGVGAGPPPPPPAPADPEKEYAVSYGERRFLDPVDWEDYDGFWCRHPYRDYRRMMRDETIASSLKALKAAALSTAPRITPAVRPADDADGEADPRAERAAEIAEMCLRSQRRLEFTTPAVAHLWEMADAMAECHKVAEVVLEPDPDSEKNLLRLARVKVKPRWSYRFVVDGAMNVVGYDVYTVEDGWKRLEPSKFPSLAWDPHDGDPRGNSVLDEAHHAWTMLARLWPYYGDGLETFGEPIMWGQTAPDAEMVPALDPATNLPIPGRAPMTPQKAMSIQMARIRGGYKAAGPHGSGIDVIESTRDNVTMANGIGLLQGRMIRAILLQVRATVEAKHGSKADSETGENILATLVRFVRSWLCAYWRRVLRVLVEANYGAADADELTPEVSLGEIDAKDLVAFAQAIGLLFQSGYFAESQLPHTDQVMGFPQRVAGAKRVGPQKDNAALPEPEPSPPRSTEAMAEVHDRAIEVLASAARRGQFAEGVTP